MEKYIFEVLHIHIRCLSFTRAENNDPERRQEFPEIVV